jgi:hypothetical protein
MPRIEYPEFGLVNERSFPAAALDAGLRGSLEDFKRWGLIHEYRVENGTLTLWRPWIKGQTQDEFFRWLPNTERINYSHQLFRRVQRKLEEIGCGHGALHPRNIILRQGGGFELVDAIFNRVRLNPLAVMQDDPWLWGPCVPKSWTLKDWDRVSLLRTTTLLAQNPATWEKPIPTEQAAEMCRKWADEFIQSAPAGADVIHVAHEAVALLPALLDATFELPPEAPPAKQAELIETRKGKTREGESQEIPGKPYASNETEQRTETSGALAAASPEVRALPTQENREQIRIEGAMGFSLSERLKKAVHKKRGLRRACRFVMWVAGGIISLVLAFYGGVFAEHNRDFKGILWRPGEAQELKLSQLMTDSRPKREVVYVFALDVSGSLLEERASDGDVIHLQQRMSGRRFNNEVDEEALVENCRISASGLTRWHLARAQACSYLHLIEDGARVGLWKFSRSTQRVSDYKAERFEKSEGNLAVGARRQLVQKLMDSGVEPKPREPEYGTTDFEILLKTMHEKYIEDPVFRNMDLRFVIISDFVHDVSAGDLTVYARSRHNIAQALEKIREAGNATFHLLVIGPRDRDNSVLGLFKDHLGWDQWREDFFNHPDADSAPDFLYGFVPASRDLVFYYPAGTTVVEPVRLVWDEGMVPNGRLSDENFPLLIGLRPDEDEASDDDLAIHVAVRRPLITPEGQVERPCPRRQAKDGGSAAAGPPLEEKVLRPEKVHEFTIRRSDDYICLRPNSPEKERTYSFKLMFSCAEGHGGKKSYVVDVKFQKYLPELVSVILAVCAVAIILSLTWYAIALLVAFFQVREGSQGDILGQV